MSLQPPSLLRASARSMGLKLLLVCGLALVMMIPAFLVSGLLGERRVRSQQVRQEVGDLMGGPQTFLGPVLAVPYAVPGEAPGRPSVRGVYVVFPAQARARVSTKSEVRKRSLFNVPVYRADLVLAGDFDLGSTPSNTPPGAVLDWSRAELLVGASDPRGAQADATLTVAGKASPLVPAATAIDLPQREGDESSAANADLRFFGAGAAAVARPGARFTASARLKFSGAQRLAVLPYGKATSVRVIGDWGSPSFDGGFLPTFRRIDREGFSASWSVPFIARGVPSEGDQALLSRLGHSDLGVSFVQPADPYQSVARSLKYALMFVGLVFLTYFVFETMTGRKVHAAQYVLIGLAQMVFYLLLLSLSEQIGFDGAFFTAATATVGLISTYAGWVFASRRQGVIAFAVFALLYGLIYVLMRLEDYALVVGAATSFLAIAAVMYVTRRLQWYGSREKVQA